MKYPKPKAISATSARKEAHKYDAFAKVSAKAEDYETARFYQLRAIFFREIARRLERKRNR